MKTRLLILLFISIGSLLMAQEDYEEDIIAEEVDDKSYTPMFSLGIEFDVPIPLEDFQDNLNSVAFGFGGSFLVRTNPKSEVPVLAGLSGGWATYDSESQNQILLFDGITTDARLITRNSIFMGHGVLRILPPISPKIQPFFDGMIGFKNLYTRTTLEDREAPDGDDVIETYVEQGDWAFSFGGALGVQILLGGSEDIFTLFEVRCAYLKGDAADYLVRNADPNIQIVDTIDAFEEKNSTTDMFIPQIGLSFVF